MNRLKLWVYMAVLLGAGIGNVWFLSRWFTDRSMAQLDRELGRAASQVDARSQILSLEAAQLADAVARDPAVVQALSSDGGAADAARAAAQVAGGDPSRSLLVAVATGEARTVSVNGATVQADARIEDLLSGVAGDATRREGYVAVGDGLYYLVAAPAGKGAGVAVGVPITAAWLAVLRESTGCDITLLLTDRAPRGTLPARETSLIERAARGVVGPVGAGALPSQATAGSGLPPLSLLFARAPAYRARTVALKGLPGGALALSLPAGPLLSPLVSYGWLTLLALAVLLLLGLATGLLITNEQKTMVPKDLVAAADRITRGDFSARAPVMAGSLGTIATALNRAAEAAQGVAMTSLPAAEGLRWADAGEGVAAPQLTGTPGGTSPDLFGARAGEPHSALEARGALLSAAPSEDEAAPPEYAEAAPPSESEETTAASWGTHAAASPEHAEHAMAAASHGAARLEEQPEATAQQFEMPPPEPEPSRWAASESPPEDGPSQSRSEPTAPEPEPEPEPDRRGEAGYTAHGPMEGEPAAGLSEPPERTAALELDHRGEAALQNQGAPGGEPVASDEEHWRVVYGEFLKTREQCGEPREGVPYERFRLKLQKNRDQLVAKYACRTVRFQVYVKEGRAALKASPVR